MDRARLQGEIDRLVGSIAAGIAADTVAPAIAQREAELVTIERHLRTPRAAQPNLARCVRRSVHRAATWKAELRAEPRVARLLLRRLVSPLTLWNAAEPSAEWLEWEASMTPALLEGLVRHVAPPEGKIEMYGRARVRLRRVA